MPIELNPKDIETLVLIDSGELHDVEAKEAGRLILMGYLAPLELDLASLAPAKTETDGRTVYLRVTYGGAKLLAALRESHAAPVELEPSPE
ncbi:hypothetical protein RKE25_01965 [Dyella sp. BiH032]|uniref:hypothetical protein n=1 Tax=Dyella sp. BiH032 TaxID=3075430 RepID=UPI0028934349|nr:hypothetical protein [Dyella sp. BiH032]WNL46427.1 hypothetical protein RKE25_01965 [Dyella sp. BiH032]